MHLDITYTRYILIPDNKWQGYRARLSFPCSLPRAPSTGPDTAGRATLHRMIHLLRSFHPARAVCDAVKPRAIQLLPLLAVRSATENQRASELTRF
jgi:hypothetical protein